MGTIRAVNLKQWAGTVDARNKLGELIRRLIHAGLSLKNIAEIQFLANEANQLSGWDGVLSCHSDIPWIPNGRSLWELGAGVNERAKVKSDFEKRLKTDLPDGWDRTETVYVAVSLAKFNNRTGFEKELIEGSQWKGVQIVDAAVLEEWIEQFIGVETWLQEIGVGPITDIISLNHFWMEWSESTEPPVSPELVLVEREEEASKFSNALFFYIAVP